MKVYGLGVFSDWGMWPFTVYPAPSATGVIGISDVLYYLPDGSEMNPMIDIDGPIWENLRLFNKANQLGIFDQDSLTQKSDEYANKCDNGQYMVINASWWMTNYNQKRREEDLNTLNGYQMLPLEGQQVYANNYRPAGAPGFMFVLSANTPNAEPAIKLLDYLNSYDGIRFLMCGTEGDTIEIVDGKPEMKAELILKELSGDLDVKSLFWRNSNLVGYTEATRHPVDGQPLKLTLSDRAFSFQCSPMDTDYSSFYGALYPHGVINNFIDEGRMSDYRYVDHDVLSALQPDSDEVTRIRTLLNDILFRTTAAAILAPDDAAFLAVFEKCVQESKDAGIDIAIEFDKQNYANAVAEVRG